MPKNIARIIIILFIVFILLVFLLKTYIIVEPGERAVIFNQYTGTLRVTPGEGFYFLIPIIETPTKYDIKVKTYTMSSISFEGEIKGDDSLQALTQDGQYVFLDISMRFHPDMHKLINLHREIGIDYVNKVVRPQIRSYVRMIVSEYPVTDVYSSQRMKIQNEMEIKLKESLSRNYVIADEVLLRNVKFTNEFQQAVENKQIAQQEAQRMKYVLEKQELEKKRKIIEAEGESEALSLKGKALAQNPALIQYEYVKLLAPNVQAIIAEPNTIFNFSDFMKNLNKEPKK